MANWSKVKRGILICSLSGLNFAIRNMNFISLAVSVNYFSKYRIKENSLLSLRRNYFSYQMCKKNFFIFARFLKTDHRYSRNSKERWYKNYFIELSCSVHAKKCSRKFMVFAYISVHQLPKKESSQYGNNSSTQSKALNYGAFRQTEWTVLQWTLCRKLISYVTISNIQTSIHISRNVFVVFEPQRRSIITIVLYINKEK